MDEVIVALQIGVARLLLRHEARADVPVGQMRHRLLRRDIARVAKRQHRRQVAVVAASCDVFGFVRKQTASTMQSRIAIKVTQKAGFL